MRCVFNYLAICVSAGLGGEVIGFKYWKDPGAFVEGGVGTVSVLLTAGFSFQGTEIGKSYIYSFEKNKCTVDVSI